ncbi:GGDEF domain-containing protein [Miltoncostaea oceani]|uniref:GGDEF domain-containing protein n=1 Tax=Miltoncostaea oceani TaxID=2843216 RepID=UPI001C3C6845|nr:GGDEF domain-containing protein [Miltoncostaea oceani]
MPSTIDTPPPPRVGHARRPVWFLQERNEAMLVGRAVALGVIAVVGLFVPEAATAEEHLLAAAACAVALVLHVALWAMSRRWSRRLLLAVDAAIVIDAALILVLAHLAGAGNGIGLWLLPLLAVAVTLGYDTLAGVKALILGGIVLAALRLLGEDGAPPLEEAAAPLVIAVALVIVAGYFARVNERDLNRQLTLIEGKWTASAALTGASEVDEVVAAVRRALATVLPGWDVDVVLDRRAVTMRSWRERDAVFLETPLAGGDPPRPVGRVTASRPAGRLDRVTVRGRQMAALREVADDAGSALVRIEERERFERQALADPLTGLGNRRAFDEAIVAEMSRIERSGDPLGLVMIDVDHFKRFNDRHGHQAGDAALVAVARAIERGARAGDRACRVGGEEFALLLPGADEQAAAIVAERVRAGIEASADAAEPITVSLGVAAAHGGGDVPALVRTADARLYAAKGAGRNRVVSETA